MEQLALIGYPISHSKSDVYHNRFIAEWGLHAHYDKFEVFPETLAQFLQKAKQSNMLGLSVTMPLKTEILPLLDHVDERARAIGAVNTVKFHAGKAWGYNTDALGAYQTLLSPPSPFRTLQGKKAILLGAGGVARAITWELLHAGAHVTLINRTPATARTLAHTMGAYAATWEAIPALLSQVDLLVNATSVGMLDANMILEPALIPSSVTVFDVISAPKNNWIDILTKQGNPTLSGKQFWQFQAMEQYKIWYGDKAHDWIFTPHF